MLLYRVANIWSLIIWPDSQTLRNNMPAVFCPHFIRTRCIIDCFEIFIERPTSFDVRTATYLNYKKHNTVKVLLAVSPTGSIVFISRAWGGCVPDKCGFLEKVEAGDIILADCGFNVHDNIAIRGARLVTPASTRGKSQLPREDVEKSRQIARAHIHVERVIGQL